MNEQDKGNFSELFRGVAELYGKEMTVPLLRIYWNVLKRYEYPDIERAVNTHAANPDSGQFMPKPADIVRMIEGTTGTQGLGAWAKVEKAIRHVGPWQSIVFDDPLIHAVIVDMGGWVNLCSVSDNELPFRAKEFERRYQRFAIYPPSEHFRSLTGIAEVQNSLGGFRSQPPVLMGNQEKALLTYRTGIEPGQQSDGPKRLTGNIVDLAERMKALPPAREGK